MSTAAEVMSDDHRVVRATRDPAQRLKVRVGSILDLADGIRSFELLPAAGGQLPPFAAGAHVDVHLPGGAVRQYSLCNDPADRQRYVIAVLREEGGRGGSIAMHERVRAGDEIVISSPRNRFPLAAGAARHIFLAGGIGITPIMSMIAVMRACRDAFHLYYCTRSPQRTAFLDELAPLLAGGQVTLHHDGGDPRAGLDLVQVLGQYRPGDHLYCCGPAGFMDAVRVAAGHWPRGTVHFERFNAPPASARSAGARVAAQEAFDVVLASTGQRFGVQPGESIVEVLRANGIDVDTSCEEGYCGTCITRYLEGDPVHRDSVLDEEDRREFVMICCARAKGGRIVLDL